MNSRKVGTFQESSVSFVDVYFIRLLLAPALIVKASSGFYWHLPWSSRLGDRSSDDCDHVWQVEFRCRSRAGRIPDLSWWLAVGSWFFYSQPSTEIRDSTCLRSTAKFYLSHVIAVVRRAVTQPWRSGQVPVEAWWSRQDVYESLRYKQQKTRETYPLFYY